MSVASAAASSVRAAWERPAIRPPLVLAAATVFAQIAYPLVGGPPRDVLTVVTVLLFFVASVTHATATRGAAFALTLVVVTAGGGLLVEAAGTATGVPFGAYDYTDTLGWKLLGVPAVIPLAWTMMGYPALIVARRITRGRVAGPLLAGLALASWDLFLDPQMVQAGHWVWRDSGAYAGIPATNFAGWLAVAIVMMLVLWPLLPEPDGSEPGGPGDPHARDDVVPLGLYLWTYGSSVLAHAAFFGNPEVALVGGLVMGVVVVLLVRALVQALRRPARMA